jgi:hypothetical protein
MSKRRDNGDKVGGRAVADGIDGLYSTRIWPWWLHIAGDRQRERITDAMSLRIRPEICEELSAGKGNKRNPCISEGTGPCGLPG